ncbi:hypothetical protein, partial [Citrobacter sp. wls715]|uniref:hypothetical protein n=1 Tax=Citrobacter sp. wls715 TaxID=2576421 RepID=UPI001BAEB328
PLSPPLFKHLHALLSTTAVTDVFFFEYPHKFVVLLPSRHKNPLQNKQKPASYEAGLIRIVQN